MYKWYENLAMMLHNYSDVIFFFFKYSSTNIMAVAFTLSGASQIFQRWSFQGCCVILLNTIKVMHYNISSIIILGLFKFLFYFVFYCFILHFYFVLVLYRRNNCKSLTLVGCLCVWWGFPSWLFYIDLEMCCDHNGAAQFGHVFLLCLPINVCLP